MIKPRREVTSIHDVIWHKITPDFEQLHHVYARVMAYEALNRRFPASSNWTPQCINWLSTILTSGIRAAYFRLIYEERSVAQVYIQGVDGNTITPLYGPYVSAGRQDIESLRVYSKNNLTILIGIEGREEDGREIIEGPVVPRPWIVEPTATHFYRRLKEPAAGGCLEYHSYQARLDDLATLTAGLNYANGQLRLVPANLYYRFVHKCPPLWA